MISAATASRVFSDADRHTTDVTRLTGRALALAHKGLLVRWHSYPDCGASVHQYHNTAKHIQWVEQTLQGGVALAAL